MFWLLWKKEIKVFFTNKGNLVFMVLLPILLISIFSFALGDYIKGDYGTFQNGQVFYCQNDATEQMRSRFAAISAKITEQTGVSFTEVTDAQQAKKDVEASKAYGLVTIGSDSFSYFRSSFNEPQGGQLVRTLFTELARDGVTSDAAASGSRPAVIRTVIAGSHLDAKVYYTFAALTFSILFMGVLVGHSVFDEKELGTLTRIRMSRAGVRTVVAVKILTGILCGAGQVLSAFVFSSLVLRVNWGDQLPLILLVLLCLVTLSSTFGAVVGSFAPNKSMCQSTVMMTTMLCGYLGGAITPLYLLENMPILGYIVKISPLYWTNQSMTYLYNGIVNSKTGITIGVLLGLTALLLVVYAVFTAKLSASASAPAAGKTVEKEGRTA